MLGCVLVFVVTGVIYLQVVLYEHFSSAGVLGALVRVAGVDVGVVLAIVVLRFVTRLALLFLDRRELADASDYGSVAGSGFEETAEVLTAARRSLEPTLLKHLGWTSPRIIGERLELITVYDTRRYLQTSRPSRTDFACSGVAPFPGHSTASTFGVRWKVEVGRWWIWEPPSREILLVVDAAGEAVLQCPPSKSTYPATAAGWRALVAAHRL